MVYAKLLDSQRRQRACTGKLAFATRAEAKARMRSFARHRLNGHLGTLRVYRCEFCDQYHFGHQPQAAVKDTVIAC